MRTLRVALWLSVAVALFGLGVLLVGGFGGRGLAPMLRADGGSAAQPGAPLGGPFALVDQNGAAVTEAVLRGKPSALFFGYTHCPDVCPTTLMEAANWIEALGADADRMRFVFVTVDPARDTPEVLKDYVSAFSTRIIGISGPPEKVEAMARDHKVFFSKVPAEGADGVGGGDYMMDHTASVLLLDQTGGLVGTIAQGEPREAALAKLRRLVAG